MDGYHVSISLPSTAACVAKGENSTVAHWEEGLPMTVPVGVTAETTDILAGRR